LAVPLNLVIFGVVWHLAGSASEAQRTSLLYTARSVVAAVDAELGKYLALAEVLSRSPALLDDNLDDFEAEALRAFVSTKDAWVLVSDPEGQQLFNSVRPRGERLPIRNSIGLAAQRRALETHSIIISDVQLGIATQTWIINIEVPIYKNGQPFRVLSVSLKAESFLRLLNDRDIPKNWLAGIIDSQGRYIARVPGNEQNVAQLTSESWRREMHHQNGVFERFSSDGDPIVAAQARSSVSGWMVGVAVKKAEIQAAVWSAVSWVAILGGGLLALSLLFAAALSRRITGPIAEIRQKASTLLTGAASPMLLGPPEIEDLWQALKQSAADRNRSVQALRESEERFRGIYEHAGTGIAISDMQGRFQSCNPAYTAMLGYSEDELHGLNFSKLVHPEDHDANLAQSARLVSEEIPFLEIVNRYIGKDGRTIWVHKHICLLRDADGCPTNIIGLVADITERKRHEEKIRESEERLLVALAAARQAEDELSQVLGSTVAKQEAERQRIARELHDTLGQTLTLLKLGLDELGRALPAGKDAQNKLTALKALVSGVGSEVNRLAWEIRPTALDDLGLETAIRHLVETWSERSNLQFGLHLALNDRRMDAVVETTLYRVLQEAITNIAKHAEAARAGVLLEASAKEVRMIVEDDGRGFSPADTGPAGMPPKRLGLLGIRERLSLVSGTLEVESAPGSGCTLFVRVPL
jgi:PAS domain S-box-containing protein